MMRRPVGDENRNLMALDTMPQHSPGSTVSLARDVGHDILVTSAWRAAGVGGIAASVVSRRVVRGAGVRRQCRRQRIIEREADGKPGAALRRANQNRAAWPAVAGTPPAP